MTQESRSADEGAFEAAASEIRSILEVKNRAREEALRTCREIIQHSARAIRAIHRAEMQAASELIEQARERVAATNALLTRHKDLFYAGYVHDSQKEYVEASAMLAIVGNSPLPAPGDLAVEPAAYLNGMAEAASEARRFVLDCLRCGQLDRAEAAVGVMDDIYSELISIDFPDAITGGLRRTTDALRAVLERTRGDLTMTMAQSRLEAALKAAGHQ